MKGKIYCCCKEASSGCENVCPKGRKLKPFAVFVVENWRKESESYKDQAKRRP